MARVPSSFHGMQQEPKGLKLEDHVCSEPSVSPTHTSLARQVDPQLLAALRPLISPYGWGSSIREQDYMPNRVQRPAGA